MKVVLDIKNIKTSKPIDDKSILLYDAMDKKWYITSKESLLSDFNKRHKEVSDFYKAKYEELENKFNEFQTTFSEQYKQIVELVKLLAEQERIK